ncbi:MAG: hypothetical protein ACE5JI_15145 [Acidobacteriota bacterium]
MRIHAAVRSEHRLFLFLVAILLLSSWHEIEARGPKINRNRSFYLPVQFVACPGLEKAKLWIAGEGTVFQPGRRVFHFTYYAERKEVLPSYIEVRIHADKGCDGRDLDANIVITLEEIASSTRSVKFDMEKFELQLHNRRRDAHFPIRIVRIQCHDHQCAPSKEKKSEPQTEKNRS